MKPVRIGLLGCGNVGAGLVSLLDEQADTVSARTGLDLAITRIAVRSTSKDRSLDVAPGVLTSDAGAVVDDPDVDVVVELIGGIEPARELVRRALTSGKPVVTANKELLANHGAELFAHAEKAGVDLLFEAAVAGAIPLVRSLRESLVGEPIERVMGIVNGTTNYILTRMAESGASYADALAEAQSLGFAERDPTADVEGHDAGAKAAIIATVAFGALVVAGDVYHEGISDITSHDIETARRLGYVIKAVAVVERTSPAGEVPELAIRVHPAMIPAGHALASVRGSFNAVFIEGGAVGDLMLYGRGAGGRPTASAVLGDLIDASTNLHDGAPGRMGRLTRARVRPIDDLDSAYYLGLDVADRAGVLAQVAEVFGRHAVSIRSMEQQGLGDEARLIFITHRARERDVQSTLHALRDLDVVRELGTVLRVVGDEDS
ncbi:MAG: homoserine dehydrogenase [Acidimicrobiales bacterium]